MTTATIEERLATLEEKVEQLSGSKQAAEVPWWEAISGTFADCPDYDEAMRLGREYRESLRPDETGVDKDWSA